METDKFADWKSKSEAAHILRCSNKTIERLAGQNKIQKVMRRIPGRRSTPVYHPGDIEGCAPKPQTLNRFRSGRRQGRRHPITHWCRPPTREAAPGTCSSNY